MSYSPNSIIQSADSASVDAFGRWRVSQPTSVFDCQFTYDLQPLIFEQVTSGGGAIAHSATNRQVVMELDSAATSASAYMQSYVRARYQPGKSQEAFVSFNFWGHSTNITKFAGLSDGMNGIEFRSNGTVSQVVLLSDTQEGDVTVAQTSWNLDTLNGSGPSGLTLGLTTTQILVIDLQALAVGRVRIGFNIAGRTVYVHEFKHANVGGVPYIQNASLPVRCGMTATGATDAAQEMYFLGCSVVSEGGAGRAGGYEHLFSNSVTASSGARTHMLSLRPKTTFNSIANQSAIDILEVSVLATAATGVYWELCIGQALSGTTTFNDVNATYSAMQYNTAGALSGSPLIVIDSGYCPASGASSKKISESLMQRYPMTLDAAGAVRANGTLTLLVQGLGAASAGCYGAVKWLEAR